LFATINLAKVRAERLRLAASTNLSLQSFPLPYVRRYIVSSRTIVIGILALVFGGSAAIAVNLFYNQKSDTASTETVPVVVAKAEIPRGVLIGPAALTIRDFPKEAVPAGSFTQVDEAVDRVAFQSLVKDEPVLDKKVSPKHSKGGLATLVPKGMRAFTIQTPHVATQLAGFILPGNKVDVLLTMNGQGPNDRTGGGVTTTLLQNVEVLAVDNRLDAPQENRMDPRNLQSVTLLVTPDQAAKLDLGQNRGTLHLSLRNPGDADPAKTQPATLSGLQFYQEKPWGEQLAQVIESIAKLRSAPPPEEAPKQPTGQEAASTSQTSMTIRTLRGIHAGEVQVDYHRP
jgi:pilus assembly protein CpaB